MSFVAAASGAAPSAHRPHGPLATVTIEVVRHQILVPVSIQRSTPFRLILDTGMPTRGVLLHPSPRIDALGLVFSGGETLRGAGGSGGGVAARTAMSKGITVGGRTIAGVPIIVLPGEAGLPVDVDGVIGGELFEKFAVSIDADRKRLELFDPSTYTPAPGSTALPMRVRDRIAFIDARVVVDSGSAVAADLAVDLGATHSLWLNHRDGRFSPPAATVTTTLGRGLSGDMRGQIGRVRRFELGTFAFENVVTIFPGREHQNPGGVDFRDGFVGAELLTRFHVTFDYAHRRMILEPGDRIAEPFEADMSGMSLDPHRIDRRAVLAVLSGSPADLAGIEPGDTLTAIDGEPLERLGPDGVSQAFRRDGAEVVLTIERGFERSTKRLKLRRLV
jgi:hypothetical protein